MVGMSWALSGRNLPAASPFLLNPDPQLLAVPLAKRFQTILPLLDVCVQMEQTEKQIKPPNERNLLQISVTKLFSIIILFQNSSQKQGWMESERKEMRRTEDVLGIKAKVRVCLVFPCWWKEICISNKIHILGTPGDSIRVIFF